MDRSVSGPPEGTKPADSSVRDVWPPELGESFPLLQVALLWSFVTGEPQETNTGPATGQGFTSVPSASSNSPEVDGAPFPRRSE